MNEVDIQLKEKLLKVKSLKRDLQQQEIKTGHRMDREYQKL